MRSVEGPKGTGDAFYGNEKDKKTSWFRDLFIFKLRCIYSTSKKKCSVLNFELLKVCARGTICQ